MRQPVGLLRFKTLPLRIELQQSAAQAIADVRQMAKIGREATDVDFRVQILIFPASNRGQEIR